MTADEAALWRAVLDRPDDDLARLVYADYVEEHGRGPLAGFIRAQIRSANAPPGHPDYADAVEAQSLAVAAARGASSLPAPALPEGVRFAGNVRDVEADGYGAYERGLPAAAHVQGNWFSGGSDAAVHRAVGRVLTETAVRHVEFGRSTTGVVAAAVAAPAAVRLTGVGLNADLFDYATAVGHVLASPVAANLSRLAVEDRDSSADAMGLLARASLPRLARLTLSAGRHGAAQPDFAGAAWAANLTHLSGSFGAGTLGLIARGSGLRSVTVRGLRAAPAADVVRARPAGLPDLRELTLVGAELDSDTGRALARWPLPALAAFRLVDATVTAPGLAALLEAPWLAGCVELAVTGGHAPPLADALAGSAAARSVRLVYLDGAVTSADDLVALARPGAFPALSTLSVKRAGGAAPALGQFLKSWAGARLHTLILDGWPAPSPGLQRLAANPAFASLRRLKLSRSKVPDAGAVHLFNSPHLSRLAELDVSHNTLADKSAAALLGGALPGLVLADLTTNRMHPDDRTRLRAARPGVWA